MEETSDLADGLSDEGLSLILEREYSLGSEVFCRYLGKGQNDIYSVSTGYSQYCLKVYNRFRTAGEVLGEVDLLNHLSAHDVRVARPIEKSDGGSVLSLPCDGPSRPAVLFETAVGKHIGPDELSPVQSRAFGKLVGAFHSSAGLWCPGGPIRTMDWEHYAGRPLRLAESFLGKALDPYLREAADELRYRLDELPRALPEYGICHGDLHVGNVVFDESGEPILFDFDSFGRGWRIADVSLFAWDFGSNRDAPEGQIAHRRRCWKAYLDGYSTYRDLEIEELSSVETFVALRELWVLGLYCDMAGNDWGGYRPRPGFASGHVDFIRECMEAPLYPTGWQRGCGC